MKTTVIASALMLLAAGTAPLAHAQADTYPSRPIRLVIPFAPGGPTDAMGRMLAERMAVKLGQAVVVENKPGANAQLAPAYVAKAAPDGYTLIVANSSSHATPPVTTKNLPYDPLKDFVPIARLAYYPAIMACNLKLPANNLQELIEYGKKNPNALSAGSSGTGSGNHFMAELITGMTGVKFLNVPYKSNAQSITAVIAGDVSCTLDGGAKPFVDAGKVKALGVTSLKRDPRLPNVPTFDEQGLKGYDAFTWMGLEAPARTPPAIAAKLNQVVNEILEDPPFRTKLTDQGMIIMGGTQEQLVDLIKVEIEKHRKIATEQKLTFEE